MSQKENELIDNELLVERMEKGELDHSFYLSKNKIELRGIFAWATYISVGMSIATTIFKGLAYIYIKFFL